MSEEFRDDKGRFLSGNPGSPGRKTRSQEAQILAAVREAFSPEEISAGLREAYELAKKQGSTRGMLAALELAVVYAVGKPQQSINVSSNNQLEFLAQVLSDRTPLLPPRQGVVDGVPHWQLEEDKP